MIPNARERALVAGHLDERARLEPLLATYREELVERFAHVLRRLEHGERGLRAAGGERATGHANGLTEAAALVRDAIARSREGAP